MLPFFNVIICLGSTVVVNVTAVNEARHPGSTERLVAIRKGFFRNFLVSVRLGGVRSQLCFEAR